jgi:hypothetical protein
MGDWADNALDRFLSGHWSPFNGDTRKLRRRDRKRLKVIQCRHCGAKPLRIEEFEENAWHLAEYDENNVLTRHVCKMKTFRNV